MDVSPGNGSVYYEGSKNMDVSPSVIVPRIGRFCIEEGVFYVSYGELNSATPPNSCKDTSPNTIYSVWTRKQIPLHNPKNGDILSSIGGRPNKLEVLSSAADVCAGCVSVQYYAGHYNTPVIGMLLNSKSPDVSYSLLSVRRITLDHGYAINAAQETPGKSNTTAGVTESNFVISSFSETIRTNVDLLAICATTAPFSSVVTLDADAYYPGSPSKSIDFSGVTVQDEILGRCHTSL